MWWADGAVGIEKGLCYYKDATGPIESEYDAIEARAKARAPHHLDVGDLTTIVQFKVWPGIRAWNATQLAASSPEKPTAGALAKARAGDVRGALLILDRLPRVGIPTASAILAAVYPERFAVIDRYVISEIGYLATASIHAGSEPDEALALLTESLAAWAVESWASTGAGASAYPPFIAGLTRKADEIASSEGRRFRPRDIEKALYGHFLKRTGRRVV